MPKNTRGLFFVFGSHLGDAGLVALNGLSEYGERILLKVLEHFFHASISDGFHVNASAREVQ